MYRTFLMMSLLLAWPGAIQAQEEAPPPIRPQMFKLNPNDGCYRYTGDAVEFVGRFKTGSYIGVTMNTLDANGLPLPPNKEERIPATDAPKFATDASGFWFGPLPQSKEYTITFIPRAAFGSPAVVAICGRMTPPK
jgi:hypothetical protein